MKKEINYTELIQRKEKLHATASALKTTFLGMDHVIDEVISLMMPWYLFPDAQSRPAVINLWGLTGSGKSALVKMLIDLLDYRRLYTHMDMGEFESDSATWVKEIFTGDLEFFHEKPAIICMDEFQFANTIDAQNKELGKDKLRVIWELLDSGKLEYVPGNSTYYLFRADNCLKRLDRAINAGVLIENGTVVTEVEKYLRIFDGFYFDNSHGKAVDVNYFVSEDFMSGLYCLFDDDTYSRDTLLSRVRSGDMRELRLLLQEGMRTRPATKTLDLSHALIFVLGNLDEAFTMSNSMNPDISADEFHEQTKKITIADIKRSLRKRFRPEQIARLGNNHIIYTSFSNAQFRMLIRRELERVAVFIRTTFGWKIVFDESIVNLVYAEGVFPAQGTRPVLTTVRNLIESQASRLSATILEWQLPAAEVLWTFEENRLNYTILDSSQKVLTVIVEEVKLKLGQLRQSVDPEIQAHTAVHEAGHAILAALAFRIVPAVVVSRTAADAEGFCLINFPKGPVTRDSLSKDILVSLGGFVAEKLVFGEEWTSSGVYSDLQEASRLANDAVRKFGMGSDPVHLAVKSVVNDGAFFNDEAYNYEALQLIRTCEAEAIAILQRNKLLLLKMAEYLTANSRMEEAMIADLVRKYSVEEWVVNDGFVRKEDYYRFNTVLKQQLAALEQESVDALIARLEIAV